MSTNGMRVLQKMQKTGMVIGCLVVVREPFSAHTIIASCPSDPDACYEMFNTLCEYFLKRIELGTDSVSRDWAPGIIAISEAIKASFPDVAQAIRAANIERIKNETNG